MSDMAATTVHEAYAFACMRCGYGWEQAYEIEHHVDGSGHAFVVYTADGQRVPSPLSTPTCVNCGGHVVRIMRSGRVSDVQRLIHKAVPKPPTEEIGVRDGEAVAATAVPGEPRHWHFSGLNPFHRR
ncbi:hypothetical protein ACPXCE_27840 [Streptomyces sp. DT24]|uniref:hypothetical protein n=1 Tax=unclassified Streptomyces TaxID=2593676 RepID=UPI0023B977DF|nr:hypothetical protein [Streptomyces sp. AM 4-1-1]WEH33903.1 hypothetical protein PZB75_11290 [Streptomyces sp. AM 4-1-1]